MTVKTCRTLWSAVTGLGLCAFATTDALWAQGTSVQEALIVVYGQAAPSREGDVDSREQIFFSLPSDQTERLYLRLLDPETHAEGDFSYGGTADALTRFRLFGGQGSYSDIERPAPVKDGARAARRPEAVPAPGKLLREREFGNDDATDGRWITFAALQARQGEIIEGRAYFRLDVEGARGNDGNGFSLALSLARDRNVAPQGLQMFSYRPTVRWPGNSPPTELWFTAPPGSVPLRIQSFDGANGDLNLLTQYSDHEVQISGQDVWASDTVITSDANRGEVAHDMALSLSGGFEVPNDVTLAVFDDKGAPLPLSMPPRIALQPRRPVAAGLASPLADCRAVGFEASLSEGRSPLSYSWEFGDGSGSQNAAVVHRYTAPGRYTARLNVLEPGARPGRGASLELPVHVRNAPVAVPGEDVLVAPGQVVAFDGSASRPSDSPITRYGWTFGDGAAAEGAKVRHVYDRPGTYRAVLRVRDETDHPCNFGVATRQVFVNASPVAEAGSDQIGTVGQTLRFSARASYDVDGGISGYLWDMGDGTTLEGAEVSHAYQRSGTFGVSLRVTDDSGVSNDMATDALQVDVNMPPVPRFTVPERPISVSEVARFDAGESSDEDGQIVSFIWDFGDGAMGEGQTASYAWSAPGTYEVTLLVEDNSGTASALQSLSQSVRVDAAPVAEAGPDQFVTASEVQFDGTGSRDPDGKVIEWLWDFGDGSTGQGPNPTHAYARVGTYDVALVVRDDSTAPRNRDRDTLQVVVNAAPIADAGPPQTVAPGDEVVLSGRASVDPDGKIARYRWYFPDGTVKQGERVAHVFDAPGLYAVRLSVEDDFALAPARDDGEILITVNAPPVAIAGPDRLVAPGTTVTFDGRQSFDADGVLTSYRWEFDDLGSPLDAAYLERAYVSPGVWSAQLVVTDAAGVSNSTAVDDLTVRVNHPPIADAGPEIETEQRYVSFDGSASSDGDGDTLIYEWDFGDDSTPRKGEQVTHVFPGPGVYPVTLWVDDGTGLSNARAVSATRVTILARPLADAGGNREVCSGEPILFDASGSRDPDGGLLLYAWDFGDGETSDLINPSKSYERPGVYPVTLTVKNETGSRYGSAVDRIAAVVQEGPIAAAGPDRTVCTNQPVRFDGMQSTDADGAVNTFAWTFGDGGNGSGATPEYRYTRPGTYTVTLTISGDARNSCSPLDTDTAEVTVVAAPEPVILGPDRGALDADLSFEAEIRNLGSERVAALTWEFGDGSTASGAEVSHRFAEPGRYPVTLTLELEGGTKGCDVLMANREITINAPPLAAFDAPLQASVGEDLRLDAGTSSDPDGAITAFDWDFGDGASAGGVLVSHRYEKAGTYGVRLAVTDDAGVLNSTSVVTRQITVSPAPFAGLATENAVCPGEPVTWDIPLAKGETASWLFDRTASASGASASHTFQIPGVFPVALTLTDGSDLIGATRREEVYVRVNAPPVAMAGPDRVACAGDVLRFDAGASADLDGRPTEWIWTFSDGTVLKGAQVERIFDSPGARTVTLAVRDDSGASGCDTGLDTAEILVNAPPQVDAGPDRKVLVGAAHDVVSFDATGVQDPDGQGVRLTWDFGDGARASGAVNRHRYASPGEYTVTLEGRDATGLACGIARDTAVITAVARP